MNMFRCLLSVLFLHTADSLSSPSFDEREAELDDIANPFMRASVVTEKEIELELFHELKGGFQRTSKDRITHLLNTLQPIYKALPKAPDGRVVHTVARYALHRLMAQEHGWFIKGLEPDGHKHKNKSNEAAELSRDLDLDMSNFTKLRYLVGTIGLGMEEWVPDHLQKLLEHIMDRKTLGDREVAVMAATLEDLVHREAIGRLKALYRLYKIKLNASLKVPQADELIELFLVVYRKGGNWSVNSSEQAHRFLKRSKHGKPEMWQGYDGWLRGVRSAVLAPKSHPKHELSFDDMSTVVVEVGNQFGFQNSDDCDGMKAALLDVEDKRMPGRVLLSDFYKKGLSGGAKSLFGFIEKSSYLRSLGALDESEKGVPRVIVPNYVNSRPQCRESSSLYAICCPNECESLLGRFESALGEATALPQSIAGVVGSLPAGNGSPTVLSKAHRSLLDKVAAANKGRVPLHGRLFAQWMHHVWPHQCSYPHEAGTIDPQTAEDWIKGSGESTVASADEMQCHITGDCAGGAKHDKLTVKTDPVALPWSAKEELLQDEL